MPLRAACEFSATLRQALIRSRNPDRADIEAYLAGRSHRSIQRFEVTHLARVEFTSGAQLDVRLAPLPTNDEQRKDPI